MECNLLTCKNKGKDDIEECNHLGIGTYNIKSTKFSKEYMYPDNIVCIKYDNEWYYIKKNLLLNKNSNNDILKDKLGDEKTKEILKQHEQKTLNKILSLEELRTLKQKEQERLNKIFPLNQLIGLIKTNYFKELKKFIRLNEQDIYYHIKYYQSLDEEDESMLVQIKKSIKKSVNIQKLKDNNIIYYKLILDKQVPNSNIKLMKKTFKEVLEKYEVKYVVKTPTKSYYFFIK